MRWLVVWASAPRGERATGHGPRPPARAGVPAARTVGVGHRRHLRSVAQVGEHAGRPPTVTDCSPQYPPVTGAATASWTSTGPRTDTAPDPTRRTARGPDAIIDEFVRQLPDIDPGETEEWLDSLDAVVDARGKTRARYLVSRLTERARERQVGTPAEVQHALRQHHPRRASSRGSPATRRSRGASGAFIRWNAAVMVVRANKRGRRHRRAPLDVRLLGGALRGRLQPLLPGQGRRPRRRPRLLPGPRRPGHLRPGLPRGPPRREPPRQLPPRDRRRRAVELPAPVAHARLLGVPDGVDGPRPDQLDLPGPLQPLPPQPPHRRHQRARGCGASSATARPTSPRRSARSRSPAASSSTTSSGSSTATCSASTARCAATARSSRSSRPSSAAPAGTSSRSSGAKAGTSCSPATSTACCSHKMNTTVDGEFQRYAVESRRLHPRALLRPRPPPAQAGRAPVRRRAAGPAPRRPRLPEALRRLQGRHRADRGAPTVILAKTVKGWTLGSDGRGPQRHPPDQEDDRRAAARTCATGCTSTTRSPTRRSTATTRRTTGPPADSPEYQLPDGAPPGARRRRCPAASTDGAPAAHAARRRQRSPSSPPARAARPCRPPWPSPACCATWPARRSSAPGSCRSSPTRPAPSAWTRCSASSKIYAAAGPALRAGRRRRCCSPTPRRKDGQILEEGITEAGAMASFTAAGTALRHPRRADGAVLHLLFDVRLPAGRRPHLGRGRRPGQGLPARRHRRAHHAARRGPPAPGRPQPRAGLDRADRARPTTRRSPTSWPPSSSDGLHRMYGGARRHLARRRRRLLLPDRSTTRTTRCRPGPTDVTADDIVSGPLPLGRRTRRAPRPRPPSCSRAPRSARPARPQAELAEHYGVGVELWSATSYKRLREDALAVERWNRLHPPTSPAPPLVTEKLAATRRARSSPSPTS